MVVLAHAIRTQWKPPRVEVALVAGVHPRGYKAHWLLLDRIGEPNRSLARARLFGFNMAGYRAALAASEALRKTHAPLAIAFTARVVVYGEWDVPQEVVEAWRVESRPEPQDIGRYPFEGQPSASA